MQHVTDRSLCCAATAVLRVLFPNWGLILSSVLHPFSVVSRSPGAAFD
jgi:hypothetical protein